jgi:cystathionine beta-lyase
MDDLYGGTYRMFTKIYNIQELFHYVDMNNLENVQSLINTWVETPTNPLMKILLPKITANYCLPLIILCNTICRTVRFRGG